MGIFITQKMDLEISSWQFIECWIARLIPDENELPLYVASRHDIAKYVGMETKYLTVQLRDEYNCITQGNRKYYAFSTEVDCEMACRYLETLLVAKKIGGY